ncbi:MAG: VOC family protein [Thermoleophilia bacterium]|nr:VOC family protein [Thermoleophilia bacterium]MDH4340972.1 VOC family protein [Thermoleophilia bacterium]
MLAHVAVNVTDFADAKRFYALALEPFGYRVVYEEEDALAYFADAAGLDFGIGRRDPVGGAHVAFECSERATVDRFYAAALAAGGVDNGPPGVRPQYDQHYYAAFVHDADGNNIEAVCHKAPSDSA